MTPTLATIAAAVPQDTLAPDASTTTVSCICALYTTALGRSTLHNDVFLMADVSLVLGDDYSESDDSSNAGAIIAIYVVVFFVIPFCVLPGCGVMC